MGTKFCGCCNKNNDESEMNFGSSPEVKNSKNNSMFNENLESNLSINDKWYEFQKNFEAKLPELGEYISKEQFREKIPKKVLSYMNKNEFKIPDDINTNKEVYLMNPIKFKNDDIYEGNWNKNIIKDGKGLYYKKNEKIFIEGIWDEGVLIYGRIYYPNNDIYEGYISDFNSHGKGKLIYDNGDIYEGDFVNGEMEGKGKIIFKDNTIYEGNFSKSKINGYGIMKWIADKISITYEGEFSEALLNNYGKLTNNDGEQYEGNFKNNFFNGKGKYTFEDGSTYEGDFESGIRSGKGIYNKKDEFNYDGSWADDYPHGTGTFTKGNIIIKGTWCHSENAEISSIEGAQTNDFNKDILNFNIPNINLIPDRLPHLGKVKNNKKI